MDLGIGFTDVVARTTRGQADLKKSEIAEGAEILREKLAKYKPKIAVFNGKAIYEVYSGQKKFMFGKQPEKMEGTDTWVWVMPSSSARCAQLPRAIDKVPFYEALKKFRDFVTGKSDEPHEEEIVFANVDLKNFPKKFAIKVEPDGPSAETQEAGFTDSQVDPSAETQLIEEAEVTESQVNTEAETQVMDTDDRSRSRSGSRSRSSKSRSRSR